MSDDALLGFLRRCAHYCVSLPTHSSAIPTTGRCRWSQPRSSRHSLSLCSPSTAGRKSTRRCTAPPSPPLASALPQCTAAASAQAGATLLAVSPSGTAAPPSAVWPSTVAQSPLRTYVDAPLSTPPVYNTPQHAPHHIGHPGRGRLQRRGLPCAIHDCCDQRHPCCSDRRQPSVCLTYALGAV